MAKPSIVKNEIHTKIKEIEVQNNIKFSTIQKVLLSIEESITAILDVLYGSVSIFPLNQHFEKVDEERSKLLDLPVGDVIYYREVIIYRKGKPMVYSLSYISLPRWRREARDDLIKGKLPLGKILKKYDVESRRDLKKIYVEEPSLMLKDLFKCDDDFVSREYNIIKKGRIILWTKESFPISYFKEEI